MTNNLRRLIAILGVATVGVVSSATGAYSQASQTETTSATATLPAECTAELALTDDFDGDTIDIGGSTDDLEADATLTFTCNTTSVSISESNIFDYSGSVVDAGDNIFDYVTVTANNFDGTDGTADTIGAEFAVVPAAIVSIDPGVEEFYNPPGDEIIISPDGALLPAGLYTYTKIVTVAPN